MYFETTTFTICALLLTDIGTQLYKRELKLNLYQQLLLCGLSKWAYWLSHTLFDSVLLALAGWALQADYTLLFSVAHALFLACFNKIVTTENSLITKMMQGACGILAIWVHYKAAMGREGLKTAQGIDSFAQVLPLYSYLASHLSDQKSATFMV